ncbi:DUF2207 domain-containing protein [Actinokineospora auranticolor]|uniref:Putative membrane protein DUF2207 n=1 Tax=Actinokineospora auranticolor TaxID=155976 RepID=A0A2S6GDX0_9PSEU|nr:DUF2207 domain-containing protein [Actinokineospora auranticolor]PPK63432.1 putative membrane protein DUF2207 [Actinokineospora auranticolor]
MLTNWGVTAAALVAGITFGAAQPSFPSLPPNPPTIDFPVPTQTGTGVPPTFKPIPAPGSTNPRPSGVVPTPVLPRSVNVQLKVERDGSLTVQEQVIVQARQRMKRTAPLRIGDRVFTVRDATVQGNGTTAITPDTFTIDLGEGASTVRYTVDGAIADLGDRLQFRWPVASGWDSVLVLVRASLLTPKPGRDFVCLAGPAGTEQPCQSAVTDSGGILRVRQGNLAVGGRIDLSANLDSGMVPVNARFERSENDAFALTPLGGGGLGLVALLLLGGFAALWTARGRDAKALVAEVPSVDLLATNAGQVSFASPDGVLPGQAGTVVDERVDARDLSATVVDLAVRNYLWITEAGSDWQIVRRNPADDSLTAYELAVYDALLPNGAGSVTLSSLRSTPPDLSKARSALYADAVSRNWFSRHPQGIGRLGIAGIALLVVGIAGTVLLALNDGSALLGIAVGIAGLGLLLGSRFVPARTKRGSVLVQQVRGVLAFLQKARADDVPSSDREMVFSRSLPYAVALGETEAWLTRFGALDPSADGTPGLYWYATQDPTADLQRFTAQFQTFLATLDDILGKH